jgi:hypothetical protein
MPVSHAVDSAYSNIKKGVCMGLHNKKSYIVLDDIMGFKAADAKTLILHW